MCVSLLLTLEREGKEPHLRQFLSLASPPGLPVLLNEEVQSLRVGEHHIRVQAEVEVACGILAAKIPKSMKDKP